MANHRAASLLLLCCCFAPVCRGQSGSTATADALADLQRGGYGQTTPAQLEQAKAGQIIPVLKDLFRSTRGAGNEWQADVPGRIASELVLLGDHDAIYWDYLVSQARPALESDQPDYSADTAKSVASAEYLALEKLHPPGPEGAPQLDWYAVQNLGSSGDARAIPLLRLGLKSPNSTIRDASATGLGRLHDKDSIPLIVARARELSPGRAASLAATLREFNDPAATAAAAPFLPKEPTKAELGQKAFASFQAGDDDLSTVEQLWAHHVTAAIPSLKAKFETETDPGKKDTIASVLVRFGSQDQVYWDYLTQMARPAIESDAPDMLNPRPEERNTTMAPAFLAWAAKHHIDAMNGDDPFYRQPAYVLELAMAGDPRGIPLLRQALHSDIFLVQNAGAQGLAQLQDKDSIPLILDAIRRKPYIGAAMSMFALVYFDDDRAQAAVRRALPDEPAGLYKELIPKRGTRPFDSADDGSARAEKP